MERGFERRGDERYDTVAATQLRFADADYAGDLGRWQADQDRLAAIGRSQCGIGRRRGWPRRSERRGVRLTGD